jgi:hypothetical protein
MRMRNTEVFELADIGAINDAFRRGGAAKLITHGDPGGGLVAFNYTTVNAVSKSHVPTGTTLGNLMRGRFTSMELLTCYPGRGPFAQSFATASRTATRAPTGPILWDGAQIQAGAFLSDRIASGIWSLPRGTRMLTFYPNKYLTGFVRLFGY